jgi:uncharacterized protein (DUF433 family)
MTLPPTPIERQHITRTPGVCGGKACIAGSRIRVLDVYVLHELKGKSPDEIIEAYPQLTLADVYAALAYLWDNRQEILDSIAARFGPVRPVEPASWAPADRFALSDGTMFGVIASTTAPFCRTCDRARLTADGTFLLCLYGERGLDLRALLRSGASDDDIAARVTETWQDRSDRGAEMRAALPERGILHRIESRHRQTGAVDGNAFAQCEVVVRKSDRDANAVALRLGRRNLRYAFDDSCEHRFCPFCARPLLRQRRGAERPRAFVKDSSHVAT